MGKMQELRVALQDYAEATGSPIFKDEEFHSMMLFDINILASNFQYADIMAITKDIALAEDEYNKTISKYVWKILLLNDSMGIIIATKGGKPIDNVKGTTIPLPPSMQIKCVHYTLPTEPYAIYCNADSIPDEWYPLPRQKVEVNKWKK